MKLSVMPKFPWNCKWIGNSILSYLSAFLFRDDLVGVVMADDLDEPRVEVLADSNL